MMDQLIARFPNQLKEAIEVSKAAVMSSHSKPIHKAYVAGLGGSGIGADFVASFIREECKIPYNVGKGYKIPAYVDENTLCIVSSYSGNTEETWESMQQMLDTGAKIVCIASGGKIIELAKELKLDFIQVPGGWPSPRACLGYSLVAQLFVLEKLDLISSKSTTIIQESIDFLEKSMSAIKEEAKSIAASLLGKITIIYIEDRMEPVALRFRQQINENAKTLGWHRVVPEMNHNELVGWTDENQDLAVLYFRNHDDYSRNQVRMDINKEIISKYTDTILQVNSKGSSFIQQSLYLVHLGDWVSWYLSQLRGVDSMEVNVIDFLKSELAKID